MSMQLYIINVLVYVHMCVTSQLLKTVFYGQRKKLEKNEEMHNNFCIISKRQNLRRKY